MAAFIQAGPAPIYVGFGSMIAKRSLALGQRVVQAARSIGCRLIVAGGWASLDAGLAESDSVLTIAEAPHDSLFPLVAAAVHHGGAGTTTAAARAGIPQVIVPHVLDQYYWARRVELLGLGPASLPLDGVSVGALAARMAAVVEKRRLPTAHETLAHARLCGTESRPPFNIWSVCRDIALVRWILLGLLVLMN